MYSPAHSIRSRRRLVRRVPAGHRHPRRRRGLARRPRHRRHLAAVVAVGRLWLHPGRGGALHPFRPVRRHPAVAALLSGRHAVCLAFGLSASAPTRAAQMVNAISLAQRSRTVLCAGAPHSRQLESGEYFATYPGWSIAQPSGLAPPGGEQHDEDESPRSASRWAWRSHWREPPRRKIKIRHGRPDHRANAAFGAQLKNGAEQAVADINAAGGILGQKIAVAVGDDVSDPKQGVSVANKFAADGVKFVIGHFNSGVTIPASEVYQENGILEITPGLHQPDGHRAQACGTCSASAAATTSRARSPATTSLKNFKGKKIAVVHDKTTYGKGLADETKKAINQGRHEGSAVRRRQHRREGLFGAGLQDQGSRAPTSSIGAACTPRAA